MDLNRFTIKSREALAAAQQIAVDSHHQVVGPNHLMAALLDQKEGIAPRLLQQAGVNPSRSGRNCRNCSIKYPKFTATRASCR